MKLTKLWILWLIFAMACFSQACSSGASADSSGDGDTDNINADYDIPNGDADASENDEELPQIDGDKADADDYEGGDTDLPTDGDEENDGESGPDGDDDNIADGDAEPESPESEADVGTDGDAEAEPEFEPEEEIDLCSPDPCNGHGDCNPEDGSCTCLRPYIGEFCDGCAPYFSGYPACSWDGGFPDGYCEYSQCWPVTPTGQTICYDGEVSPINPCPGGIPAQCGENAPVAFCGQDAQYSDNTRSFSYDEISGETIVEDSLTGLIWEGAFASDKSWQEAFEYCQSLEYAGFSDWRLPGPHELASLLNYAVYLPSSDIAGMPSTFFWSSAPYNNTQMWAVWFFYGMVTLADRELAKCDVRCVRQNASGVRDAGFSALIESEAIQSERVLTHVVTGLIWQKTWTSGLTWRNALAYCEALSYGGYSDWRLPNVNELRSLITYNRVNPASDFPTMPSLYFWTSSTRIGSAYHVFGVDFASGLVYEDIKINENAARCVRGGE